MCARSSRLLKVLCRALPACLLACVASATLAIAASATAAVAAVAPVASSQLEEVTVQGQLKGPRLWRIRRDGHVLWLLGTPELLPDGMDWDASDVESVLATASTLVLAPRVSAHAGVNPLRLIRLYREWRRARVLPDDGTLQALLEPTLFARFERQRRQWLPGDTAVLHERPMVAVGKILGAAQRRLHLKTGGFVGATLEKLARAHRLSIVRPTASLDATDIDAALAQLGHAPGQREIACLEAGVTRLESDQAATLKRAVAWATGDVATLRSLSGATVRSACMDVLALIPTVQTVLQSADQQWLASVDQALAGQPVSFAIRDMSELLAPDGILERFRARGDEVDGP